MKEIFVALAALAGFLSSQEPKTAILFGVVLFAVCAGKAREMGLWTNR